ncbi:hypothetical protein TWF694_000181 [Orbilia ellipsospora]|uniref:Uncharacterized protein n=1 Tax=Orbilia ellipsospora TaxID=2528407 RepID=A0AAV9XQF1_9PEZI
MAKPDPTQEELDALRKHIKDRTKKFAELLEQNGLHTEDQIDRVRQILQNRNRRSPGSQSSSKRDK